MNTTKIKLAERVLAYHRAKLASTADRDSVHRAIAATEARFRDLTGEPVHALDACTRWDLDPRSECAGPRTWRGTDDVIRCERHHNTREGE